MKRRNFFRSLALGGAGMVFSPIAKAVPVADDKPETNLKDALAVPRTAQSMPGKLSVLKLLNNWKLYGKNYLSDRFEIQGIFSWNVWGKRRK